MHSALAWRLQEELGKKLANYEQLVAKYEAFLADWRDRGVARGARFGGEGRLAVPAEAASGRGGAGGGPRGSGSGDGGGGGGAWTQFL